MWYMMTLDSDNRIPELYILAWVLYIKRDKILAWACTVTANCLSEFDGKEDSAGKYDSQQSLI